MNEILITAGTITVHAELNDSSTARLVWEALPLEAAVNRWGDEIYFSIPVAAAQAPDARAEVELGEIGYWPAGHAFCIFFGPTPASDGPQPRAYSPVNILGRVREDATRLRSVPDGATIRIARAG